MSPHLAKEEDLPKNTPEKISQWSKLASHTVFRAYMARLPLVRPENIDIDSVVRSISLCDLYDLVFGTSDYYQAYFLPLITEALGRSVDPSKPRNNCGVIADQSRVDGRQAARHLGLRVDHNQEAHQAEEVSF
jgi:hypothetical protein